MSLSGAGRMNRRITIEQPTISKDEVGGVVRAWATFKANVAAEFTHKSGREFWAARQTNAEITDIIRVRQYTVAGIGPKMRVKFGDRTMDIISVLPDDVFHDMVRLMVKENID